MEGQPIHMILVDNVEMVKILPLGMIKRLNKEESDLISEVIVSNFSGSVTQTMRYYQLNSPSEARQP